MAPRSDSGRAGGDPEPVLASTLQAPRGTPLYVHVPYCVRKCTYCDFFSVAADDSADTSGTVEALLREAKNRAPEAPDTVFVGGGTPTFLAAEELERLLVGLDSETGFRASAREVTVECNPESLTPEKAQSMVAAGVTRLSIGIQSLDPSILTLFDRPHTPEQGLLAFETARAAGVPEVSVDLIYGVPGQDLRGWLGELGQILDLGPDHVSAYSLAFEEGTKLTHDLAEGRLSELDEDLALAFFLETRGTLEARGLAAYEVSNFSSIGFQCAHNKNYWRNGTYVGLGPGAVSKLGHTRFGSPRSVGAWRRSIETSRFPATWEETPDPRRRLGETWWLGLRTAEGVRPEAARARAGFHEEHDPFPEEARRLQELGLLLHAGDGSWRLTDRGLPLADAVSRRFLESPEEPSATAATTAPEPPR